MCSFSQVECLQVISGGDITIEAQQEVAPTPLKLPLRPKDRPSEYSDNSLNYIVVQFAILSKRPPVRIF